MTTAVGNEPALWQMASRDGGALLSVIKTSAGFRYVEEVEEVEAEKPSTTYSYWRESWRSGIYETLEAAKEEAFSGVAWLKAQVAN